MSGVDYAPHRRTDRGWLVGAVSRAWERLVVTAFRATSALLVRVPLRLSEPVAKAGFLAGYYLWPSKRRIIKRNAAHVLGLPASHEDVAGLARGVYRTYSRFAIEVMRLPNLPADEPQRLMIKEGQRHERFMALWRECQTQGRGIIVVSGHIGSIEVFAGAYAQEGIPTYGLADDSAFPELFELLNASRARWGVTIIPWKRLRDIFRVLRGPAVLGMVVDWGYRSGDVPVKLFGAWTTLPAGPATLAARTGATLLPVVARRTREGRYRPEMYEPIEVKGGDPAAIAAATQAIADALEDMVAEAPEQWYTFKPMWPATQAEAAELERRAAAAEAERA
ncbi:MAG: lysophospholipid acyltransferase family protein [Candidatus Limnocylindrales bacterium]